MLMDLASIPTYKTEKKDNEEVVSAENELEDLKATLAGM